ncbi:hypothetical protein WP3W18E01_11220 [Raoultella ornithinolytica]|uniref:hypothetical protein n=1 Tax=Raoultella ornithinolytica TaxID=54291 RepID=UPI0015DC2194|nr:hypothetical protein WP3W18E01_11220 [Raoultella ornithinolytica]
MTIPHAIEGLRQLKYTPGSEEPVHQHEQGQLIYPLRGVAKIVLRSISGCCRPVVPSGCPAVCRTVCRRLITS